MRIGNALLAALNAIVGLIGLAVLAGGIWGAVAKGGLAYDCVNGLKWVIIAVGAFIVVLSFLGLVGALRRVRWLIGIYMGILVLLILALIAFSILGFVMWNKGSGSPVPGHGFQEYQLSSYSSWLQHQLVKRHNWHKIRTCLIAIKACKSVSKSVSISNLDSMSAIESGCCRPPWACNQTYVKGTEWKAGNSSTTDGDCGLWSNDASTLCFNCDSCKAGVLQNIKDDWKEIAIVDGALLAVLVIAVMLGYWAFYQSEDEDDDDDYRGKYPPPRSGTGFYVQKA